MEKKIDAYISTLISKRNVIVPIELIDKFVERCRKRYIHENGGALIMDGRGIPTGQCFYCD